MNLTTSKEKRKKHNNRLVILTCIIVAIIGAVLIYVNNSNINLGELSFSNLVEILTLRRVEHENTVLGQISHAPGEEATFNIYKNYIVKATKNSLQYFDKNGQIIWQTSIAVNKPVIRTSKDYLLVADIGGRHILVLKGKNKKWEQEVDGNIINVNMARNGFISVVHELERVRAAVSVFNTEGHRRFTFGKAENYILSARFLLGDTQILVNSVDVSGTKVNTVLEYIDISGKPVGGETLKEGSLFPSVWPLTSGAAFAVGDSKVVYVYKENSWEENIYGKTYSSMTVGDKYLVLAVSRQERPGIFSSNRTDIQTYNIDGQINTVYKIEDSVRNIQTFEQIIAVNTGREIFLIDPYGRLLGKISAISDVLEVHFLNSREILVVTKIDAKVIRFR